MSQNTEKCPFQFPSLNVCPTSRPNPKDIHYRVMLSRKILIFFCGVFASICLKSFWVFSPWAMAPYKYKHSADDLNRARWLRSHHAVSRLSLTGCLADQIILLSQGTCCHNVFYYMLTSYRGTDHNLRKRYLRISCSEAWCVFGEDIQLLTFSV